MSHNDNQRREAATTKFLMLSLVVNCAFAAAAVKLFSKPAAPNAGPAKRVVTLAFETQRVAAADSPGSPVWTTNRFHWRQVESTNYEEYVANLRAIGCPEKTLRDIVVADVDRHYATRQREARADLPFWTGGRKLRTTRRAEAAQMKALEQELASLVQRLLGVEWSGDRREMRMDHFEEQALARFVLGPMEEEQFWRAVGLIEKGEALKRELSRRTDDILTDADEAEARESAASLKREFQAAVNPAQWEEVIARMGAAGLSRNDFLEAVDLAPAEARQIALAWFGTGDTSDYFGISRNQTADELELRERQFTNYVAQLLGEKHFAEFERAQDSEFRRLFELTQENSLPRETAVKVYEIRKLAAEEVEHTRGDASLDEAARQQKFDQMQGELPKAVSGALGAALYQEYLKSNGSWITNVTKL